MDIVVCGAGRFGLLVSLGLLETGEYNVTVIEQNKDIVDKYNELYDLRCIEGSASNYQILEKANLNVAETIICLMSDNEANILTCQMAHSLFSVPRKIIRLDNDFYKTCHSFIHNQKTFAIDSVFIPEKILVEAISNSIFLPGADESFDLSDNNASLIKTRVLVDAPITNISIDRISKVFSEVSFKVILLKRGNNYGDDEVIIGGISDNIIEVGDYVYLLAHKNQAKEVMKLFGYSEFQTSKIVIASSGKIGVLLAEKLLSVNPNFDITFIVDTKNDAVELNNYSKDFNIVLGDFNHSLVLEAANVSEADLFLGLSDDQNSNIISSLSAKVIGCNRVFSLSEDVFYSYIHDLADIDMIINPQSYLLSVVLSKLYKNIINIIPMHKKNHYFAEFQAGNLSGLSCEEMSKKYNLEVCSILKGSILHLNDVNDILLEKGDILCVHTKAKNLSMINEILSS